MNSDHRTDITTAAKNNRFDCEHIVEKEWSKLLMESQIV